MAKCDLTIELDDPDRLYAGGETISGVVRVQVDADVNCNGLEVKSVWRTHGRGNVATGDCDSATLYTGRWTAGESAEYRFELAIADWPPSYHGHYLNVDHYIDARAKIPWGLDPKASALFTMRPACGPEDAKVLRKVTEIPGIVGCLIGIAVIGFFIPFVFMLASLGSFAFLFALVPLIGGVFWFLRWFLPKYLLGEVNYRIGAEHAVPGDSVDGELIIRPRKNVSINGITLTFQAREQCVSGSGSNRTTHKHVLFEREEILQEATTLSAGQEHQFPFSVALPADAPYSIDLDDNDLIWSTICRVDIPRWPDWKQELPLSVVPSGQPAAEQPGVAAAAPLEAPALEPSSTELTFDETAGHLWSLRNDRSQRAALVEAVTGLSFEIAAIVERRLLYSGDDDPHVYQDGYAVWAHYPDPQIPLVLYVPHDLADEFEQLDAGQWRGRGTVVGWDSLHERLQVKIDSQV